MPHSSLLIISPEGKENCNSRGAVGMAEECTVVTSGETEVAKVDKNFVI